MNPSRSQAAHFQAVGRHGSTIMAMVLSTLAGTASLTTAQVVSQPGTRQVAVSETQLKRETLARMLRPMEISFENEPLSNVMTFIAEYTGADLDPLWIDNRNPIGLDKDMEITLKARGVSTLRVLEMVLDQADADLAYSGGSTWQMTDWGSMQVGPRERLMRKRRIEIYDINDIILEIPNYPDVPEIDLQQALQSNQGGGGQSPFEDSDSEIERTTKQERAEALIDLITAVVEPETWDIGADIRYFQGTLIVSGPDYLHRALDGYRWWPARATNAGVVSGRRYVSFSLETGISEVIDIAKQPVTGVVGGGGGTGGGGGGGG